MSNEVKAAIREARASAVQLGMGNLANTRHDFETAMRDLKAAERDGSRAHIHGCV
jgi:hypothetical protein